jgi:hypothetical protein
MGNDWPDHETASHSKNSVCQRYSIAEPVQLVPPIPCDYIIANVLFVSSFPIKEK